MYFNCKSNNVLKIYGISQNPDTEEYIMVLEYAKGGNFNDWINKNYTIFNWINKLLTLSNIIDGLKDIHQQRMIHCDFHTGNILFKYNSLMKNNAYISDRSEE